MSTSRSNRVKAAIGTVSLTGAAMGFLAACGTGEDEQEARTVYCVDEQDRVVDEEQCEEAERNGGYVGGLPFFFLLGGFGGNRYSVGQTIPQQYTGAATRINPSDSSARSRNGMPSSGRVSSGTRISGGIGSGGGGGGS
ncbi:hypothetical protein [Modestobacter marinus]|uniref:hypothetical protein n=1 Tax=Modestobacter marinus TaxID=477641 RepID=UPI001C9492F9|nr:hypothetical protein [Modestobacter marinus]